MTKGWYGNRQRHSMASKGVRTSNMKTFKARGTKLKEMVDFDIDEHYWGLQKDGDGFTLRLGNWSDAGWYWSDDEGAFAGFLIRISGASFDDKEFIDILNSYGIEFNDLKQLILESAESGDGVYMLSGDNAKWHFGQDSEREYDIIDYNLKDSEKLSDKEVEEFKDYYWSNMESDSTDYDTFKESSYYDDLKDEIVSSVERSDSWEEVLDEMSSLRELGNELTWEYSDNAVNEDVYRVFNDWNDTGRWDKEVESGLPNDEVVGKLIDKFGRTETIKKIRKNYWDVESNTEAIKLVSQYEKDAIPKGRRKVDEGQTKLKEY